jgi:5-methylcytosine-specific restriction protein A
MRPMRVCGDPSCYQLTAGPYCPMHARASAAARGYDATHRRERSEFLARHRHCMCEGYKGCTHPPGECQERATVLDHVDGRGPHGPRGHDPGNWCALDASCHARKTRAGE